MSELEVMRRHLGQGSPAATMPAPNVLVRAPVETIHEYPSSKKVSIYNAASECGAPDEDYKQSLHFGPSAARNMKRSPSSVFVHPDSTQLLPLESAPIYHQCRRASEADASRFGVQT